MGLYESMKTNSRLEQEGIWLDLDHTRIRIGRAGGKNTKFIAKMERVIRENKRTLDFMSDEQGRKLFNNLYAETIVFDWLTKTEDGSLDSEGNEADDSYIGQRYTRGIEDVDGSLVPFNVDNVIKTLSNLPDLAVVIKETAEDPNLFKESLVKDIVKN